MNIFPLFNITLYFPSLFKYSKYFINKIEKYDGVSYILHAIVIEINQYKPIWRKTKYAIHLLRCTVFTYTLIVSINIVFPRWCTGHLRSDA